MFFHDVVFRYISMVFHLYQPAQASENRPPVRARKLQHPTWRPVRNDLRMTQIQVTNTSWFTLYQGCRFGPVKPPNPGKPILRSVGTMCCFVSENVFWPNLQPGRSLRCPVGPPSQQWWQKKSYRTLLVVTIAGKGADLTCITKVIVLPTPNKAILRTNHGRSYHRFAVFDPHKKEELNLYHPSNWYMYWLKQA